MKVGMVMYIFFITSYVSDGQRLIFIYVRFLQPSSHYPSALTQKPPDILVLSIQAEFCLLEPQVLHNFKKVIPVIQCILVLLYQDGDNS